jgi:uncharacterized protein
MRNKFINILFLLAAATLSTSASAQVVISQVYGGGGNSGATYKNDFIEIFNAGTTAQDLSTWSVQYNSGTGTAAWQVTNLSGTLQAGHYFLIQEAAGSGGTASLPTPDATGAINMGATGGRVALLSSQTALPAQSPAGCPAAPNAIVDLVGVAGAACFEGTAGAPAPSNTTADIRANNGCTDTNNNGADFTAGAPNPRNSGSATNTCTTGGSTSPTGVGTAAPNVLFGGDSTLLTVIVTPGTNPASQNLAVTANLTSIGGDNSVLFDDQGTNPDGTETFTHTAMVSTGEAAGVRSISLTVNDEIDRVTNPSISLAILPAPITIMAIQGNGSASPFANQTVSTTGNIVTALKSNGFFMQNAVGDGDITKSDAIFVFTNSAPTVHVGDSVTVGGAVSEFEGSTELESSSQLGGKLPIRVDSSLNALPAAVDLASAPYIPTGDPLHGPCNLQTTPTATDGYQANNFACLDGMLVTISNATVVGATFGSGADGVHTGTPQGLYATVTATPRPFRSVGAQYPGLGAGIPVWSGDPEIVELYFPGLPTFPSDGSTLADYVYNAGSTFSVTGVIQAFAFSDSVSPFYEIYPSSIQTINAVEADALVQPVADSPAGTLTIGTQNFLHFFDASDTGPENNGAFADNCTGDGSSDECPTPMEYTERTAKWTLQICNVLKAPAVLDLEEVENRGVLVNLASSIATQCQVNYVPYLIQGNDVSGINNGFLVRSDVNVISVTQLYLNTMTENCSSGTCLLNDRPPVLLRASWNGYDFAVLGIYDRSLNDLTDKPYVGPKRAEEAAQVTQIVRAWQSGATLTGAGDARQDASGNVVPGAPFDVVGEPTVPLFVAGDFNAYQFTDGYVDVTGMIAGTAVQAQNLYWYGSAEASANTADTDTQAYVAPSPTLVDSGVAADPSNRYSFSFDGYVQEIDHILLSRVAWKDFVSVSNAHGDSDVSEASPVILDSSTPARSGDHDGQVITIAIDRIFANGFEAQP